MDIQQVMQNGEKIIPAFSLEPGPGKIIGLQTDVQRKKALLMQLAKRQDMYISYAEEGEYARLTVVELVRFLKALSGSVSSVEDLLQKLQLEEEAKVKIARLDLSKRVYVSLARIYFAGQGTIVLEEPYFRLELSERRAFAHLLEELSKNKAIVLLAANLEDALVSCDEIYRLDESGVHMLDISDGEEEAVPSDKGEEDEENFKIQKIPTKKNDKVILFNPPEIDYIESINSEAVVHVGGETYPCPLTLAELEQRLTHSGFFRCHRSYIVNLQKVRELITWTKNSYSLRLTTGKDSVVPLSRTKLAELKSLLNI